MIRLIALLFCSVSLLNCKKDSTNVSDTTSEQILTFKLNPEEEYQTVHGFGASDAWSCQFVGANWPDEKKNQIADWLFSNEVDEKGNPKGIGLSVWRFNIGGGSAEQGTQSDIQDAWRRAECFLGSDKQYDWTKQAGQRWFLQAAKARGVENFIAFVNSPPVALTRNQKAYSSSSSQYNLPEENYGAYTDFLCQVLDHFNKEEGITFNYISPFNEPQWDWNTPGQEGTPAQNTEIASISRLLNTKLEEQNSNTKIEIPEAGKLDYLIESADKTGRGNQAEDFFSPSSPDYLGNLTHVALKLAGHSYFSTWDFSHLTTIREQLVQKIKTINPSLEYWMTEYCLLEDNEQIKGSGKDLGMNAALYMARVIHADLTVANAASWQWWTAISAYDYKDGLVYIDKNENDGKLDDSKMLWVLGNYSRFIRPGMKRISVTPKGPATPDIAWSAYKSTDQTQLVVVVNNYKSTVRQFRLETENPENYTTNCYLTSPLLTDNLKLVKENPDDSTISLPGNSVITIVLTRK